MRAEAEQGKVWKGQQWMAKPQSLGAQQAHWGHTLGTMAVPSEGQWVSGQAWQNQAHAS